MKAALVSGKLVEAAANAPQQASCPACAEAVHLRRTAAGRWSYCHTGRQTGHCPLFWCSPRTKAPKPTPAQIDPEYALALRILNQTLLDALNGGGASQLDCLFDDVAQLTIQLLLQTDAGSALAATRRLVQRLDQEIAAGRATRLRRLLVYRDLQGLEGWFCSPNAGERSER